MTRLLKVALALTSLVFALVALEGALRLIDAFRGPNPASPALFVACGDCPYLYGMNPAHPEVSSQGLRDREFTIPKPPDVFRILVLGDSVTYGFRVDAAATFAKQLERMLDGRYGRVEVINAGVNGYSAYNELQYFLSKGRGFQSDVVMVALCLNDLADPELQWNWDLAARPGMFTTNLGLTGIPDAALPDVAYNREHARPRLAELRRQSQSWEHSSRLYTFVERRLARLRPAVPPQDAAGRPVEIVGEDTLSITTLLDRDAPRMRWLESIYRQLAEAARKEDAAPMAVMLPLAYQVDKDYPYLPQEVIAAQCKENGLPCLDVLPAFRQHDGADLFLGRRSGFDDVWHLSEAGHQLVAEQLAAFLVESRILPPRVH